MPVNASYYDDEEPESDELDESWADRLWDGPGASFPGAQPDA